VVYNRQQLETLVGQEFARVLRVDTVRGDDDFFLLGGHSLLVVQLAQAIQAQGIDFDYDFVFHGRSVRGVVECILNSCDATVQQASPHPAQTDTSPRL
jgi:hypothetical protein